MSLKLVGDYPGIYIFPLAQDQPVPEVGFGFDLVGGGPIALQALTQTPSMNLKTWTAEKASTSPSMTTLRSKPLLNSTRAHPVVV